MKAIDKATQNMDKDVDRRTSDLGDSFENLAFNVEKTGDEVTSTGAKSRKASDDFSKLGKKVIVANQAMELMGNTIALLKWPVLLAGAGMAVKALSALAGGATALVGVLGSALGSVVAMAGALGPLAGAAASAANAYVALGQAVLAVKLAGFKDITAALQGNEDALKKLGPAAREFMGELKALEPRMKKLREGIQAELFPGLTKGMHEAMKNFDVFRHVLEETAASVGKIATWFGRLFGSAGFGKDFRKIGTANTVVLERLGAVAVNLVSALRHVLVVVRPLTDWLSRLTLRWSDNLEESAKVGRETGKLAKFFERTKKAIKLVGGVVWELWDALKRLGHLGRSVGFGLWKDLGKVLQRFNDWTRTAEGRNKVRNYFEHARKSLDAVLDVLRPTWNALVQIMHLGRSTGMTLFKEMGDAAENFNEWTRSAEGRNEIRQYFQDILPSLRAMGRLVRDVTHAFFEIGRDSELAPLLDQLRTDLLPMVVSLLDDTAKRLGPQTITLLSEFAKVWINLAGASMPLITSMKIMTLALQALNFVLEDIGLLSDWIRSFAVWTLVGITVTKMLTGMWAIMKAMAGSKFVTFILGVGNSMRGMVAATRALMAAHGMTALQAVMFQLGNTTAVLRVRLMAMAAAEKYTALMTKLLGLSARTAMLATGIGALIVGATLIIMNWDKVKEVLGAVWNWIKGAAEDVGAWVSDMVDKITALPVIKQYVAVVKFYMKALFNVYKWVFKAIWNVVKWFWGVLKHIFKVGFKVIKAIVVPYFKVITWPFRTALKFLKTAWQAVYGVIKEPLKAAWQWIKNAFGDIGEWFGNAFGNVKTAIKDALSGIGGFFSGVFDSVKSALISALNWIIDKINWLIRAHNKLPFVDDIDEIGMIEDPKKRKEAIAAASGYSNTRSGGAARTAGRAAAHGGMAGGLVTASGIVPFRGYQTGGLVGGSPRRPGRKDIVPAMLQPGELVLPVDMVKKMEKGKDGADDIIGKFAKKTAKTFEGVRKDTGAETGKTASAMLGNFKRGRQGASEEARTMAKNVGNSFDNMATTAAESLKLIEENLNKALKALGVKEVHFGVEMVGGKKKPDKKKFGGIVPGRGSGDKVPVTALTEPGEGLFVLNRNAMGALRTFNSLFPRRQAGGQGLQPGASRLAQALTSRFGGSISSRYRPGDPGHHGQGLALDWTGGDWRGASRWVNSIGPRLLEGIYNPGMYGGTAVSWDMGARVPHSFWGSQWGNHLDHIHAAIANNARLAGFVTGIKAMRVRGPGGPLRSIIAASAGKARGAANKLIAKKSAQGTHIMSGIDGSVARVFAKVARRLSGSRTATLALFMAGLAESGMRNLTYGHGTSTGPLQLLSSTAAGLGVNPRDTAAVASLFLTRGFAGRGGANALARQGLPAHLVAQGVQGSAFSSGSNYLAQKSAAKALMRQHGLKRGGAVPYVGSFAGGGVVPGPAGRPALATVHGGEHVGAVVHGKAKFRDHATHPRTSRSKLTITNWREGVAFFEEIAADQADQAADYAVRYG